MLPSRLFVLKAVSGALIWWLSTVVLETVLSTVTGSLLLGSVLALLFASAGAVWYVSRVRACIAEAYGARDKGKLRDWRWLKSELPKIPGYVFLPSSPSPPHSGEDIMPRTYRRSRGSDTWHFCKNCSTWPISNYVEQVSKQPPGELCNTCWAKEKAGNCIPPP